MLANPAAYSPGEAASALAMLDPESFWSPAFQREVMRLITQRWNDFSESDRDDLVERIVARPPAEMYAAAGSDKGRTEVIRDREAFIRLVRLSTTQVGLPEIGLAALAELRKSNPDWTAGHSDRDDFHIYSESAHGEQGDVGLLASVDTEQLLREAERLQAEDPFRQGELWRKFVRADPQRAFAALSAASSAGDWPGDMWRPFLWTLSAGEVPELEAAAAELLLTAPAEALDPIHHQVSDWLQRRHNQLIGTLGEDRVLRLWDLSLDGMIPAADDYGDLDDISFAVWNRSPGDLARFLVAELARRKPSPSTRLPPDLSPRFDRLIGLKGNGGLVAHAGLALHLPYLHQVDPEWSEASLVPLMVGRVATSLPFWRMLLKNRTLGSRRLIGLLKPTFLELFEQLRGDDRAEGALAGHLIALVEARQRGVLAGEAPTPVEAKRAAALGGVRVRDQLAHIFYRRLEDAGAEAASLWRKEVGSLFREVWPMDAELETSDGVTLRLAWMATSAGDAFPEAVEAILPALRPASCTNRSMVDDISDGKLALYDSHPEAAVDLLSAVVDPERPPRELAPILERLGAASPGIVERQSYRSLLGIVRRASS